MVLNNIILTLTLHRNFLFKKSLGYTQNMKILHLAKYYDPHLGGVETHLQELNALLVKQGHQVTVLTWQYHKKLASITRYNGVKVVRLPFDVKSNKLSKLSVWKVVRQQHSLFAQADVVQVHDVFWWLLPLWLMVRKKVFITFHGWETKYPVRVTAKLQRYIYSKLAKGSIHVGAWIQQFYWDKPDLITYGGVRVKKKIRSSLLTNHQRVLKFVFIGRLAKDNDVEKYLELIELFKSFDFKVNVTWVGDGELKTKCTKVGEVAGLVKNVQRYIEGQDFVFASSYLSILEAQSMGGIVCSFYSNNLKKSYLESFPLASSMFITNSVKSMFKKINSLVDAPKLKKQLSLEVKQLARQQTWDKVLNQYLQLWQKRS